MYKKADAVAVIPTRSGSKRIKDLDTPEDWERAEMLYKLLQMEKEKNGLF